MTKLYAGLDVSDRLTHICVVDEEGAPVWRGACATDPEVLAKTLKSHAPGVGRVVLETGVTVGYGDRCNCPPNSQFTKCTKLKITARLPRPPGPRKLAVLQRAKWVRSFRPTAKERRMTRKKPISEPPATVRAQRPHLAPDANRSFHRIDELDTQNSWQHHPSTSLRTGIDADLLPCPEPAEGKVR